MTTKFSRPVYRETAAATIRSKTEKPVVVGLVRGDIITLRLKRERKTLRINVTAVFRYASKLDAQIQRAEKAAARKLKKAGKQ